MTNDDQIAVLKLKLQLYGYYIRWYQRLEHRYFEINQELAHNDMPLNSASNLGIHSADPYHPADERLMLEYTSIEREIVAIEDAIVDLGITGFLDGLSPEQRTIIDYVYVKRLSQRTIGLKMGMSQSTVYRAVNSIFSMLMS